MMIVMKTLNSHLKTDTEAKRQGGKNHRPRDEGQDKAAQANTRVTLVRWEEPLS